MSAATLGLKTLMPTTGSVSAERATVAEYYQRCFNEDLPSGAREVLLFNWPLAFAALLELVARARTLQSALGLGWAFGWGQFVVGLNWIATAFTFQAVIRLLIRGASATWLLLRWGSQAMGVMPMGGATRSAMCVR